MSNKVSAIAVNTDKTAAVNQSLPWLPVRKYPPPLGVKLLLINAHARQPTLGQYMKGGFWTHWQGLPKFTEDETA